MDLEPRQRFGIFGVKVRSSAEPLNQIQSPAALGTRARQRKVHHFTTPFAPQPLAS